jgi:hypothetical protein
MPESERNSYPNLILLCGDHHTLIDKDHGINFSVEQLHQLKDDHEAWVDRMLSGTQTDAETQQRRRQELLLEAASASHGRLVARWVAAGVHPELAVALADDDSVGAPTRLGRDLPEAGLVILEGDLGSGKSVTGERIFLIDNVTAADDETASLPVYLTAKSVSGLLLDAVRTRVASLGEPTRNGVRLVLDGLDEPGQARAVELLDEARALVRTWPRTRVIVTARPGLPLQAAEPKFAYPPLNDEEAAQLAESLGANRNFLLGQPERIRAMLHLPLFLIVAALRQRAGVPIPRSRGTFLRALVDAALDRTGQPTERTQAALESLAQLTVTSGGPIPAAELGDRAVRQVLESRLVNREGGLLRFALPVLEQYFAAQPLLEDGPAELDLDDRTVLDRWRDTLVLAVTIGGWQQVSRLLDALTDHLPGLAAWVVANAVPSPTTEPSVGLPSDIECARRIHHALSAWVNSLTPVSEHLLLTDSQGKVRMVGAGADSGVTAGLRMTDNSGDDAVRFPRVDPYTGIAADGSPWGMFRSAHVPGEYVAWPWQWGLDWIADSLETLLKARALEPLHCKPFQDERRWQLAKCLVGKSGNLLHAPINGETLMRSVSEVLTTLDERNIPLYRSLQLGHRIITFGRGELASLVRELDEGTILAEDRKLHRPYPVPDQHSGGLVRELYSDESLRTLIERVYTNALVIYRDLVAAWFPNLEPTLGLASFMPVLIRGQLLDAAHSAQYSSPYLTYRMTPLELADSPRAEIELVTQREAFPDFEPERAWEQYQQLRQKIAQLHPGAESWATPHTVTTLVSLFKDTPATALAYRWLWDDLRRLHLVKRLQPWSDD